MIRKTIYLIFQMNYHLFNSAEIQATRSAQDPPIKVDGIRRITEQLSINENKEFDKMGRLLD